MTMVIQYRDSLDSILDNAGAQLLRMAGNSVVLGTPDGTEATELVIYYGKSRHDSDTLIFNIRIGKDCKLLDSVSVPELIDWFIYLAGINEAYISKYLASTHEIAAPKHITVYRQAYEVTAK